MLIFIFKTTPTKFAKYLLALVNTVYKVQTDIVIYKSIRKSENKIVKTLAKLKF